MTEVLQYKSMFTKEELELIKAMLNTGITIPIGASETVVSLKNKIENELKNYEEIKITGTNEQN